MGRFPSPLTRTISRGLFETHAQPQAPTVRYRTDYLRLSDYVGGWCGFEIKMERPAPLAPLSGEFDAFLFSSIGEDRNGGPLSVVSLLTRRDLDPWVEAARLATLPEETATRQLTLLIQTITYQPLTLPDPQAIAVRLIALLPHPPHADMPQPTKEAAVTFTAALMSPKVVMGTILIAIYLIFTLGNQWLRSRHAPSNPASDRTSPNIANHRFTDAPPPPAK